MIHMNSHIYLKIRNRFNNLILSNKFIYIGIKIILVLLILLQYFSNNFPRWELGFLPNYKFLVILFFIILVKEYFKYIFLIPQMFKEKKEDIKLFLLILFLIIITRSLFLLFPFHHIIADFQTPILMAKHISEGVSSPIYYYGQHYLGAPIAYIYAIFYLFVGHLKLSVYIGNIILFSIGIFISAKLYFNFFKDRFYIVAIFTSLFSGLEYFTRETLRGFTLILLLYMLILLLLYNNLFKKKKNILTIGLLSGLLFFQYQPSIIFLLSIGCFFIFYKFNISKFKEGVIFILGFITGSFPYILSEFYNNFVNIKSLFLNSNNTQAYESNGINISNFFSYFSFLPKKLDYIIFQSTILSFLLVFLFIIGIGVFF